MALKHFRVHLENNSDFDLSLVEAVLEHGDWTEGRPRPPGKISPNNDPNFRVTWQSESHTILGASTTGTMGHVVYQIEDDTDHPVRFHIGWNNPLIGEPLGGFSPSFDSHFLVFNPSAPGEGDSTFGAFEHRPSEHEMRFALLIDSKENLFFKVKWRWGRFGTDDEDDSGLEMDGWAKIPFPIIGSVPLIPIIDGSIDNVWVEVVLDAGSADRVPKEEQLKKFLKDRQLDHRNGIRPLLVELQKRGYPRLSLRAMMNILG